MITYSYLSAVGSVFIATAVFVLLIRTNKKRREEEKAESESCGSECCGGSGGCCQKEEKIPKRLPKKKEEDVVLGKPKTVRILFGSQTGTAQEWANKLREEAEERNYIVTEVQDLSTFDLEDLNLEQMVLFVISTYTDGKPPDNCIPFFKWIEEHTVDFRVDTNAYEKVRYGVFGIGNSIYGKNFNQAARDLDKFMHKLKCKRVAPVGSGDTDAGVEVSEGFEKWSSLLWGNLERSNRPFRKQKERTLGTPIKEAPRVGKSVKKQPKQKSENENGEVKISDEPDEDPLDDQEGEPLLDLEDIGQMVRKSKPKKAVKKGKESEMEFVEEDDEQVNEEDDEESSEEDEEETPGQVREMLTPSLRKALTKQGYKLLGTHSGVKMCRWTKAMLRGRGGCYKHTFYGIQSFQCMEMTPSLACANKCVFCWRHHKNPVGKDWKWKVDDPDELFEAAVRNHRQLIKQMRGLPGLVKERFDEASTIRHCALSLVGEPITYPYINRFVDLLHANKISSFMVTNAQFPDKIDELKPVTQLYISVDAATKDTLKAIDRPIFDDFWERFLACIDSLSKKGQRTVFRLTLVKEFNMEDVKNYVDLIGRGKPSFIEIKGVTYCGTSKASTLTMKNVPFHEEVVRFSQAICSLLGGDYELACEHEHSCCVLIAHKSFKVDGTWHTWIDYQKFHDLIQSGKEFNALDYMEATPSWAVFGAQERGFDPDETRFRRHKPYQGTGC